MLKLRTFCLFLLIMLNSSVVSARTCFLPGVFASDGCVGPEVLMSCKDFYPQTTPCEEGQIQKECTDNGKTYYKCDCSPEHQVFDKEVAKKYDCTMTGGPDPVCGCLKSKMKCNGDLYPIAEGECQNGSKYSKDSCEDSEGIHFSSCECGDEYAYTCAEEGLRAPDTEGFSCHNSSGQTLYTHCECAELWQQGECSSNSCEATKGGPVERAPGIDCYLCGAEVCSIGEVNLETYFCAIPTTGIKTNCETLGYKYDVEGLCADGKDCGCLRCIFDENYVLCDKQEETECTYASEEECLEHEGNETCVINYDGCYIVTECEYGYQFSADKTQCEEIVCSIDNKEYVSNQECEASIENSVCEEDEKGCYKVSGCVYGYIMSADETECEEDCSLKKTPLNRDYVMCDTANGFDGNEEDKCVNSARPDKVYYPKCMKAETCYDVIAVNVSDLKKQHSPYFVKNKGYCDLVLPESVAQKYLKQGYYKVEECQPVDASVEKKYRLHACKDTRLDCLGRTSSVDDAKYTTSCISPDDHGTTRECGGQTYKICQCNNLNRADNCGVVQVSGQIAESLVAGMPINGYLFTGEIKDGCNRLRQQYVYVRDFRSVGRDNKKCKNIKEKIDDAVAVCVNGQSVCPEGENGEKNALATSGVYTRCKVPCYYLCKPGQTYCPSNSDGTSNVVETEGLSIYQLCKVGCKETNPTPVAIDCEKYAKENNMDVNQSGGNCRFEATKAGDGWVNLSPNGIVVAGSNGLPRTCYYKASCTAPLTGDCLKLDSDFKMVTKGYKACGKALANVPLKQDYDECGGYYYSLSCCADKSGCYVENDAQKLENLLNTNLYYHVLTDVLADEAGACYYYASCGAGGNDCSGNPTPSQFGVTKEQCESAGSVPLKPLPGCGGNYYESCSADCTYKETETSCRQVGLAFEPKCVASGTISYGICVERSDEEG